MAVESGESHESSAVNREQPSSVLPLETLVGRPYQDFDEAGHYIGCFEPLYLIYPQLPKYPLPEGEKSYFPLAFKRILEHFEKTETPQTLDLIVFRFRSDILHIGIFLGAGTQGHPDMYASQGSATSQGKFLHVERGSAFEIRRLGPYANKILGYYKVKYLSVRKP